MIQTLQQFNNGANLFDATSALLSKLNIQFDRETAEPINVADLYDGTMPKYLTDVLQNIDKTYYIGLINDLSLAGNKSGNTLADARQNSGKYDGMFVFACDAMPDANLTRTAAAALTRAFNRIALTNPVVLVLRQENLLTLSTCELSTYQQSCRQGEKVGRVTMLRNVNCAKLHAGHRQILERVATDVKGSRTFEALHTKWLSSFNIDVLSDKFFDNYKAIYEDIVEYVTGKRMVKEGNKWVEKDNHTPCAEIMTEFAGFADPEKTVRDYVKNLMGRLVFIQFLQKKGWMGVPAGDKWEGGDPEFLQNLFANSDKKETFVDDVLEPLFNDLNTKRHGDLVTNQNVGINIKVPYLNGGLFELDDSDDTKFALPSRFMKKLFDFFASYNFTIDENAPDNVEIGVDPEMLGRIFENLLEDNKEKGAFYTPKEIVQYMCHESLIAYLTTCVMRKQGESHKPENEIRDAVRRLLDNPEEIVPKMTNEHLEDFGRYIREVKICDPAIGSGAFPMGLLNELVRCRVCINAWAKDSYDNLLVGDYAALKADIICNNIYGVDIEKGAIDIARLRFWLSIIVDLKMPHALPNFDYKFMQGNSLITTFNGEYVNLDTKNQTHVKVNEMRVEKKKLYGLKQRYYDSQGSCKHELAVEIKKSILRLVSMQFGYELRSWYQKNVEQTTIDFDGQSFADIRCQLPQDKQDLVNHAEALYKQLNNNMVDIAKRALIDIRFFDWRMMFTEVFEGENPGFDIVIGNPPYIQLQKDGGLLADLYEPCSFKTFDRKGDIYSLFYENGDNLLKKSGVLCYITSNKWMRTGYGENTRRYFMDEVCPCILIDFVRMKLFDDVTVETNILLFKKEKYDKPTVCASLVELKIEELFNLNSLIRENFYLNKFETADFWILSDAATGNLKNKIKKAGTPLSTWDIDIFRGVLTGFNDAFVISTEKKDEILSACRSDDEREKTESIIRPIIRGKDVGVYLNNWANWWLICTFPAKKYNIEDYPALKEYLLTFGKERLEQSGKRYNGFTARKKTHNDWFETQDQIGYWEELNKPKILWKRIGSILRFAYDEEQTMCLDSTCLATGEMVKFLCAVFNSKLGHFMLQDSPKTGTGDLLVSVQAIEPLVVPEPSKEIKNLIETIVDRILSAKKENSQADTSALEAEIDKLVYELYGLTEEEIKVVEGKE